VPLAGLPGDIWLILLSCVACSLAALLGVRAVQRALARRRRLTAAESAARQSDRIAQLIGALAAARTPQAAIEAALLEPLQALDADAGVLVLAGRDGRFGEIAHLVGYGADESRVRAAMASSRKTPASDAVGRGAPVFVEDPGARTAEYGRADPRFGATAAIPLLIGSRVVAVVQLEFEGTREFPVGDREYLGALQLRSVPSGHPPAHPPHQRAQRSLHAGFGSPAGGRFQVALARGRLRVAGRARGLPRGLRRPALVG